MFTSRAAASRAAPGSSSFSMLGADTVVTGDIAATADLHIDGRVEGDISCHALVQGEDSEIAGAIRAETVRIAGSVKGMVAAREVVILRSARVAGDIAYDTLTMEQGARLEGRLIPNGGQVPPALADMSAARAASSREEELLLAPEG